MRAKISGLITLGYDGPLSSPPQPDPFVEEGALQEATLLGVLYAAVTSTMALLFDLRTSLYYGAENTAILILRRTSEVTLRMTGGGLPHIWVVAGSYFSLHNHVMKVSITDVTGQQFNADAHTLEFITGFVTGIDDVAAEIAGDQLGDFLSTTPNWESDIEIISIRRMSGQSSPS